MKVNMDDLLLAGLLLFYCFYCFLWWFFSFYVLVFEKFFVLLAPYVCFHSFSWVKVTEWPPIGKIAAHSAYDMFHGIST